MYNKKGGSIVFGEFFKEKRIQSGKSLRQFCVENNYDAGNISKMERGLINPPGEDDLKKYATALGIEIKSEDWIEFRDLAFAARGKIPPEVLANHDIVNKLPIFFRTIRGDKVPEEQLMDLVSIIKKT